MQVLETTFEIQLPRGSRQHGCGHTYMINLITYQHEQTFAWSNAATAIQMSLRYTLSTGMLSSTPAAECGGECQVPKGRHTVLALLSSILGQPESALSFDQFP